MTQARTADFVFFNFSTSFFYCDYIITAVFDGKIKADNLNGTHFSAKGRIIQVNIMNFTTQRDLLQFYLDLNAGGTPHSQQELDKVRAMLTEKQT